MRQILAVIILVVITLMSPGTTTLDGTARGTALGGVALDLGRRKLALAFVEYRPGRVYWRAAVAAR